MLKIKLTDVLEKGKTYQHQVTTGNTMFTAVFARRYSMHIINIDHDSVAVRLDSVDIVPSGYRSGGSEREFGMHVFPYTNEKDINTTGQKLWTTILTKIDPSFVQYMGK